MTVRCECRHGERPDGICCVVGTLASGFPPAANKSSDLIYSNTDIQPVNGGGEDAQYFWEAFPAGAGPSHRTTYLFSYLDAGALLSAAAPHSSAPQTPTAAMAHMTISTKVDSSP